MSTTTSRLHALTLTVFAAAALGASACTLSAERAGEPGTPAVDPDTDGIGGVGRSEDSSGGEANGGTPGEGGDSGSDGAEHPAELPEPDTTAPSILSITPEDGTDGVEADAVITLTFDEPMDATSTEAAFDSAELEDQVSFTWNDEGTSLTITPLEPLAYAEGTDDVAAKTYSAAIATTALDRAGNPLQSEASTTFTTLRRFQRSIETNSLFWVTDTGAMFDGLSDETCGGLIGDTPNTAVRTFARFDLSQLPGDLRTIESVVLGVSFTGGGGDPYDWGSLNVDHYYEPSYSAASLTAPSLGALGKIADIDHYYGWQFLDVTSAVLDDLENGATREHTSGYRFSLPVLSDSDDDSDFVLFDCDPAPKLDVTYTRP
jgi:hypothetical protein